ncbi:UPF0695 membrane protein [Diplonema papillatum]|nr:UPF0695 membrane protein [Diplonema papillatum]
MATETAPDTLPVDVEQSDPQNNDGEDRADADDPRWATASTVLFMTTGAVLGVMLRHALDLGSTDSSQTYVFANFLGCVVIAFVQHREEEALAYLGQSVVTGIKTGFCGALTTFSSWQKASGGLVGPLASLRIDTALYLAVQIQLIGIAISIFGYDAGRYLSSVIPSASLASPPARPHGHGFAAHGLSLAVTFCVVGAAVTGLVYRPTTLLYAVCFAPFGVLLRYCLSFANGHVWKHFPLGTFAANMLGSASLGAVVVIEHVSTTRCALLYGVGEGFCGSLTTVSTFVAELKKYPKRASLIYCAVSVLVSQLLFIAVIGGYTWSSHHSEGEDVCA